ncbi:MAG: ComF family protein [Thermoleophilia bacterium]|nr:ComF family protein [Thermoleophilia bacterium]
MELLDLVLPRRCAACGQVGSELCAQCVRALPRLPPPFCERCGAPTAWPVRRCAECSGRRLAFATARAAVIYDDRVRAVVRAWKEHGRRHLGAVAAELVTAAVGRPNVLALAFVPPDADRLLRRGHHPAERLARELGRRWRLPVVHALAREEGRARQRGLSLAVRRRNVAGAFRPVLPVPPRVALVDDVYTSGATAAEAASALRKSGARRVHVVTFARAVR